MALALAELGIILFALFVERPFSTGTARLLLSGLTLALGGLCVVEFWISMIAVLAKWGSRHVVAHCVGMVFCGVFFAVNMNLLGMGR